MTDSASNVIQLALPGAKGKVEVTGALGIISRVQINGERARPQRGGWSIPLDSGGESKLTVRGFFPGFQRFVWNGDTVLQLGAHVGSTVKAVTFSPFLLLVVWALLSPVSLLLFSPIPLVLFFMSIPVVKNPLMPSALRIALPIINTAALFVAWFAIASLFTTKA